MPVEALRIIKSKSKVCNSRNKVVVAKVISNSSTPEISPDVVALTTEVSELKNMMKTVLIDKQKAQAPAPVKAVEQSFNLWIELILIKIIQPPMAMFIETTFKSQGTLPSQTVTNPREHVNAITTRSGKTCEGPSTPLIPTSVVSTPLKEPQQDPKTSMEKVQKPSSESTTQVPPLEDHDSIFIRILKPKAKETVQEPISPDPNSYQPKLPYPERMKVR
ncbi:hypothetical protein Tco_0862684 [Tanacetum coccineum]